MDLRSSNSDTIGVFARQNIWQFLSVLCDEYNVKSINASDDESLEEATFRALIHAVQDSIIASAM